MTYSTAASCRKRPGEPWLHLLSPCPSPSDPDVDAAARPERASVGPSDHRRGHAVIIADDQPLRLGGLLVVVAVVLAERGLVAQAESQSSAAGFQAGVVQRLLQLRCVLPQ